MCDRTKADTYIQLGTNMTILSWMSEWMDDVYERVDKMNWNNNATRVKNIDHAIKNEKCIIECSKRWCIKVVVVDLILAGWRKGLLKWYMSYNHVIMYNYDRSYAFWTLILSENLAHSTACNTVWTKPAVSLFFA